MSDGRWSTGDPDRQEDIKQARFNRMKILRVNTAAPGADDASGFAALDPTVPPLNVDVNGGPHFILSAETNDGQDTLGFEFGLIAIGTTAPGAGGFTVTVWRLVETLMQQTIAKNWLAFEPRTGVAFNQLYHSFDTNTAALRFQIANVAVDGPLLICFAEL
jgi:hypothetical protein